MDIPRGIEVLVKKAAVDPAFREVLLRERGAAAARIGLALEPAEQAMLAAIPARQLEQVIAGTRVPAPLRAAFMGYAAAAMLTTVLVPQAKSEGQFQTVYETNSDNCITAGKCLIRGVVLDLEKGERLTTGVTVILEGIVGTGLSTAPYENGRFAFANIKPGRYTMSVEAKGYQTKRRENIVITCYTDNIVVNFDMSSSNEDEVIVEEIRSGSAGMRASKLLLKDE